MASAKNTILSIFTYALVMVLAGSTVYFYLKSQEKSTNTLPTPNLPAGRHGSKLQTTPTLTPTTQPQTTLSPTPALTKPAQNSNHPSNPAQTYKIGPGETLFGIATKLNMNWTRITEVNNLENGDNIKEGQILFIPSFDEKTKKLYLEFTVDTSKATQIQDQATNLPTSPYLDPAATSKQDAIGFYGLAAEDIYLFISKNELDGTAIVDVTHKDKKYEINLIQPVKKGKDGIWTISKIIPQ